MPALDTFQKYANDAENVIKKNKDIFNKFFIALASGGVAGSHNLKQSSLDISYQNGGFVVSSKPFFGKNFKSEPIPLVQFTEIVKHSGINLATPKIPEPPKQTQAQQPSRQTPAPNQRQPDEQAARAPSAPLTAVARATPLTGEGQASQVVHHQKPPPAANTNLRNERSANHLKRIKQLITPAQQPAGTTIASLATNQSSATTSQPQSMQYGQLPNSTNTTQNSAGNNNQARSPSVLGGFSAAGLKAAAGQAKQTTGQAQNIHQKQVGKLPTQDDYLAKQAAAQREQRPLPSTPPPTATAAGPTAAGKAPIYDVVPPITDPRKREMPIPPTAGQASTQSKTTQPATSQNNVQYETLPRNPVNYEQLPPTQAKGQAAEPSASNSMSRENRVQRLPPVPTTTGQASVASPSQQQSNSRRPGVFNARPLAASASSNTNDAPKPAAIDVKKPPSPVMGNLNDVKPTTPRK